MKKKKNILKLVKRTVACFLRFFGTKTWFFTILFFFLILAVSVFVWWQCVYRPSPSTIVLEKLERERENFDDMGKEAANAITLLQKYRENYNNAPEFDEQRELFINLLDGEVIKEMTGETEIVEEEQVIDIQKEEKKGIIKEDLSVGVGSNF